MARGTNNLPSWVLKNDFGEVEEAMFRGVKRPYEIILSIENSDLVQVA
jgi:hypothetical protein